MRHNRAVKKLITRIGGFRPWSDKDFEKNDGDNEPQESELVEHENEDREESGTEQDE
jgi:hypothetical protein